MSETVAASDILDNLFRVVVDEARRRPEFAEALLRALPSDAIAEIAKAPQPKKPTAKPKFDPHSISAIAVYRQQGEMALRAKLAEVRALADLRAVAKASGVQLPRTALAKKATARDLIDGIVAGVQHYIEVTEGAIAAGS